jgi:hypothetical protein
MRIGIRVRRSGRQVRPATPRRGTGQALVEFALVFPIFLVMLLGIIEFAFVFNAVLTANFATRDASLIAAEAGSGLGADCVIIAKVMEDMRPPVDAASITQIIVYRAKPSGAPWSGSYSGSGNVYNHVGTAANPSDTTDCSTWGGSSAVPFARADNNYPEGLPNLQTGSGGRCNYLNGCPSNSLRTRDAVGVQVTYEYTWHTPLRNFLSLNGGGYTIVRSNEMRMEPIL